MGRSASLGVAGGKRRSRLGGLSMTEHGGWWAAVRGCRAVCRLSSTGRPRVAASEFFDVDVGIISRSVEHARLPCHSTCKAERRPPNRSNSQLTYLKYFVFCTLYWYFVLVLDNNLPEVPCMVRVCVHVFFALKTNVALRYVFRSFFIHLFFIFFILFFFILRRMGKKHEA